MRNRCDGHGEIRCSRSDTHKQWGCTGAQVWRHAAAQLAQAVVAGLARGRGRCTSAGRGSMAADLAELSAAAAAAVPRDLPAARSALQSHLHLVNAWIKVLGPHSLLQSTSHGLWSRI